MAVIQSIVDLVEICYLKGIQDVVICPGSRNAALTINFVRSKKFNCFSIPDERSAAFVAMGMAWETKKTVVLICTSGSAVHNFAPAISEAFFSEIPLLILSADRPSEWIHQYDGQTIYQQDIFGKHVKLSRNLKTQLNDKNEVWAFQRIVNEVINSIKSKPHGPVHLNLEIKEPFYPEKNEVLEPSKDLKIISEHEIIKCIEIENLANRKILMLVGQEDFNEKTKVLFSKIVKELNIPIVSDSIGNIHGTEFINFHDLISNEVFNQFDFDLLISFGKSMISKSFKNYLRTKKNLEHWHVQENENLIDPFQTLTTKINISTFDFLTQFLKSQVKSELNISNKDSDLIFQANLSCQQKATDFLQKSNKFNDFTALSKLLEKVEEKSILSLGNSMTVRYANILPVVYSGKFEIQCNRGTSGIDGCLSTALGIALKTDKLVICVLGDVSFQYDKNSLWNNHLPKNLIIIILNNGGGNIFKMIDGPANQPETEEFLFTAKQTSAKNLALDANLRYMDIINFIDIERLNLTSPSIIEVFTDSEQNVADWKEFKSQVSN